MKYTLEFPPGTMLLTANGRSSGNAVSISQRWRKQQVVKELRELSGKLAKEAGIPLLRAVRIKVAYYPPDRRKRDSSNLTFFSSKAAIDGLIPRIIKDDNDQIVRSLELVPGDRIVKGGQMVIELEEAGDERD